MVGGHYGIEPQILEDDSVRFIAEDGREMFEEMFEVRIGKDGHTLEIHAVSCCRVDGILYEDRFVILPTGAKSVEIKAQVYEP